LSSGPSGSTVLLLSTSDTDLLAARASGADYRLANPARLAADGLPPLLDGADVVVVRLLGGEQACRQERPLIVLGGEFVPDAALMALSSVPAGIAAQAHEYLAHGGPGNARELAKFLADTVLMAGHGFAPPQPMPSWGLRPWPAAKPRKGKARPGGEAAAPTDGQAKPALPEHPGGGQDEAALAEHPGGGQDEAALPQGAGGRDRRGDPEPVVAVLYYRAHELAGNTAFVDALAAAIGACGARPMPVWCASLRTADPELLRALGQADVLVVTVLAAGGTVPALSQAGGDDDAWDVGAIAALDIPVVQALCLTSPRDQWAGGNAGLSPLDAATQVAIPEFDGRIISVPFSFKETGDDGLSRYVPDPERAARVAGTAVALARLRHVAPAARRIAIVLSAYPTKHSRIGNAVGLDTPASTVRLLRAMRERGYDVGPADGPDALPGVEPPDGDALIHAVIAAGGQDPEWLTDQQLAAAAVRIPAGQYRGWFGRLPAGLRAAMEEAWGPPPGELFVDRSANADGDIVLAALRAGNVVLLVQPPRGFGENPVAIYHDPDLPPSHHYVAAYRWLEESFGAHAVVHIGKHGNLEWLPGKSLGMSAACAPDAALGNLPLVYPFLVNDPGEGTQAKRRAHATIVDHLVPPMTRAETYGDLARLEQLMDEHAAVAALDPAKLPAIRAQIWTLIQAAKLDHDLGLESRPHDAEFDDFLLHVDGWLCEIKDAQIRDGLHVLGEAPEGEQRVGLVLAMLQARQIWSGGPMPGLREALGLAEDGSASRAAVDQAERLARSLAEGMERAGWQASAAAGVTAEVLGRPDGSVQRLLRFAADDLVPRLAATTGEIDAVLHALDGGHVPAGPSGSPLRGLINTLPTGRNFYAVDPKAVPSRLAWETGQQLAASLLDAYREDTGGEWPSTVGLSVWGTAAMRTSGDDVAEVLALLGVRPVWDDASRRVTGLEVIPPAELGRPRIDVVIRISGFFRDAFPHVVTLVDDAVRLVAGLDEGPGQNFVRAHADADAERLGDLRRATTRIFGSPPGSYGAGLLPLIESRSWRDDADLAEVYAAWGGHAYGRGLDGRAAREDMESAYRRIRLAVKNTDSREHDIADSDDYYQYQGGMIATVRALTGQAPRAYVGDNTRPAHVRTRSLAEESARVFRSRVVNPRWIQAMRRHGYKGAFELAATVDYLFGWDATTGVVADWMYEQITASYVLDPETRKFLETSNPWALRGITERLLEAASRGLWQAPDEATLDALREAFLEVEGQLEETQA
jgi:cobaltochelatase CobN